MKKLTALILCAALLMSLFGCTAQPAETTVPPTELPATTTAPTEPPAEDVYANARAALDSASDISLEFVVTSTLTVVADVFSEQSSQTLTYRGLGTDSLLVKMDEQIEYSVHNADEENEAEAEEDDPLTFTEIYADGTVYISMDEDMRYSGTVAAEDAASRYLPVVLLDAALYGSVTSESTAAGTTITFADPTAPESWAMPEGAEMLEASGSALITSTGVLEQMNYTITYQLGPAQYRLEVQSRPLAEAAEITVPGDTTQYPALDHVDALRQVSRSAYMMGQGDTMSISSLESVFSQAAGVVRNQSNSMDLHGRKENTMTKIEHSIYLMDYSTGQSQELDQEEVYRDGKYTLTVDDGLPTSQTGVSYEDIREYCGTFALSCIVSMNFWENVTCTDLGSTYLLEYTLNEDFGNTIQNGICTMFWEDPAFLNNLATAYVTNETAGYIAIDKYTGLPTAAGYNYKGTHTIEGNDYELTMQVDQSIEIPAKGAYYAITEEMPAEDEPEVKPTPLFYHVTGADGQEMWLLGTIHVGDERTAYLPQEIYDAFVASDALALEIDSKAFDELLEEDDRLQDQISDAYYYSGGKTLESLMEAEDYALAVQYMKASGNYNMNAPYLKASIWSQSIDNFFLRQGYQLHGDQGVEERLHAWAEDLEKEIREVESTIFQIQMMTNYSDELQLLLLEESIGIDARDSWEGTMELYELWCAGDEQALRDAINEETDLSQLTEEELAEYDAVKPLLDEYNKAMSYDRNEGMLRVAIEYLESGDVVFYAVGLAHLLDGTNGLVDALRAAGYTVELVTYAN